MAGLRQHPSNTRQPFTVGNRTVESLYIYGYKGTLTWDMDILQYLKKVDCVSDVGRDGHDKWSDVFIYESR